ncbi:MAG: N-acetylmuramoyl-L-alanine amidase family protein [Brotaphodocola sp.]
MKKTDKWLKTAIFALSISVAAIVPAFAADKTISSVTIRVDSELEPGDTLPNISYLNGTSSTDVDDGDICILNSNNKYSIVDAEWVTSTTKEMSVGDKPTMKVRLSPNTVGSDDYYFKGTYRSSNVNIKDGDFMSASKDDGDLVIKLRVEPIEGDFPEPEDAYWKDNAKGTAKWKAPDEGGTGRYEVVLRRGSTKVTTVETTGTSYNFYPYMTKEGTYTFRVRTIAKSSSEEKYGKSSEWVESDEIYLAKEDVSDGTGQQGSVVGDTAGTPGVVMNVGWRRYDNGWYYYYPDGSYQRDSWKKINDKWYLFQSDGRMLTGWQNRGGQTYYLTDNGDMLTGWILAGNRWYYLNPTTDDYEGCLLRNTWQVIDGKTYCFGADGAMLEGWNQVDGSWYYFYPGAGNKAVNTHIDGFYVNNDGVWVR